MHVALLILLFVVLLLTRLPVALVLLATSILYALITGVMPPSALVSSATYGVSNFLLMAVPSFILVAELMNHSSISRRIYDFSESLLGHVTGGLAHVNILGSVLFAGMTGSSTAELAGLGRIQIDAMTRRGYPLELSSALTATSSMIGPIIPPSIIMVVYASMANESPARMFMAGFIPGLIMAGTLMVAIYFLSRGKPWGRTPRATWGTRFRLMVHAVPALITPLIILGGLQAGVFTPTEAGAVSCLYALVIGKLVYRDLRMRDLPEILKRTALATGNVMMIYAAAHVFSRLVAVEGIPTTIAGVVQGLTSSPVVALLLINIVLLIGGMFVDPTPLLLILGPVLLSLAKVYDINLVHLGLVTIVNLMIGTITPPFAIGLYTVSDIVKVPFNRLVRATVPFYFAMLAALLIITYVPQTVLWLPNLFMPVK